jgi:hypothetical protein
MASRIEHAGMVDTAAAVAATASILQSSPLMGPFLAQAAAGGVLEWLVSLLAQGPEGGRAPPTMRAVRALATPDFLTRPALSAILTLVKAPANARRLVRMPAAMDWFLAALNQAGLRVPAQVRAAQSLFLAEGAVQDGSADVALLHAPPSPAADDEGGTEGQANPAPPVDEGDAEVQINPGPPVGDGEAEGAVSPAAPLEADPAAPKADPAAAPDADTAAAHKADTAAVPKANIPAGPDADTAAVPKADTAAPPKADAAAHKADPAAGVIPSGGVFPTTPEKGEGVLRRGRAHRADPTAGVLPAGPDEARADAAVTPTGIDEACADAGVLSTAPYEACADAGVTRTAPDEACADAGVTRTAPDEACPDAGVLSTTPGKTRDDAGGTPTRTCEAGNEGSVHPSASDEADPQGAIKPAVTDAARTEGREDAAATEGTQRTTAAAAAASRPPGCMLRFSSSAHQENVSRSPRGGKPVDGGERASSVIFLPVNATPPGQDCDMEVCLQESTCVIVLTRKALLFRYPHV